MKENGGKRTRGNGDKGAVGNVRGGRAANGGNSARAQRQRGANAPRANRGERPQSQLQAGGGLPACSVARQCGACQHVNEPYQQQLAAKDQRVAKLFSQVAGPEALRPILGMDNPYCYRNKVMSPFAPGRPQKAPKQQRGQRGGKRPSRPSAPQRDILCGMYAAGTHRIIDTSECLIENAQAKQVIRAVRSIMLKFGIEPYDEDRGTGFMRHAVVRVGHTSGEVLVTLVTNAREFPGAKGFCRELVRRCPFITTVVQNINERQTNVVLGQREQVLYGPGFILDELCGLSFRISSQSFYQVNSVQTEVLYRQAIKLANFTGAEHAIDAYCGTGTIGLVAASMGAAQVTGVDCVESSIRDARQNARHNGVDNAQFVVGDAGAFMRDMAAEAAAAGRARVDENGRPLVLLMDPPRAGSSEEFLRAAVQLAPSRIVYISCNPEPQVRDLAFLRQFGFEVRVVQPVDMFPHTDHVETIALIERA